MTPHASTPEPDGQVEIDAGELSGIFAVPDWLRRRTLVDRLLPKISADLLRTKAEPRAATAPA